MTLDLDLAFLVSAYSERARKRGSPLSTDEIVYQSPGTASKDTSPRVALISIGDNVAQNRWDRYQCSSNEATEQLSLSLS